MKKKTINRYYVLLGRTGWDEDAMKELMPRIMKKYALGTRRMRRRDELQEMRTREHCRHEEWDMAYSYIPGEFIQEPDYEFCIKCGMKEMELAAMRGNQFWQRQYPLKKPKIRVRAIKRLEDQYYFAQVRKWESTRIG